MSFNWIKITPGKVFSYPVKGKTASEEKQWQQLPKDKMKRIWRLQWQTLGRLLVGGALIWGMVLLGYWVYNKNLRDEHVIFLCCSSIFIAMVWPIFRFVANKMKWFLADGIAIEKFSKCLKAVKWRKRSISLFKTIRMSSSRLLLRIIIFSVFCVLLPLSLWVTNPSLTGHYNVIF
ncbi:MAG: hypothetical protein OMM_11368, partial [Candidatus Magnetoglobus multicellularis str. Araruama]